MIPRFRILFVCVIAGLCSTSAVLAQSPNVKAEKGYPFAKAPWEAFEDLKDLSKVSGQKLGVSAIEAQMFGDVAAGKTDKWSFATVALVASGVSDRDRLLDYLKRIDTLEAEARRALAKVKGDRAKGDQLLRFLHGGVMSKGYELKQSSLSGVLTENRFNCVSSAVLYNILAERIGLQVGAVEIPATALSGHIFSILRVDGTIIEVETTNKLGFNPKGKRERPDGESYDPAKNRGERREIGSQELAAIIYYNRGVELSKDKKYHPALLMYFRALCLDAANGPATGNIIADLGNWGLSLSRQGKHEDGLHVYAVAVRLAPDESNLQNNYVALWQQYALLQMKAGKEDTALTIARRAAIASSHPDLVNLPVGIYQLASEELIKQGRFGDAMTLCKRGLAKLEDSHAKEMNAWTGDLYVRWSDAFRKRKKWTEAFAVLTKAQADFPEDRRFIDQGHAIATDLVKETASKEPDKLAECIAELRKNQPQLKELDKVIADHLRVEIRRHTDKKQFETALDVFDSRKGLIEDGKERQAVGAAIYDRWARARKADGWKEALEIYAAGLKAFPGDDFLRHNAESTCDAAGVPLINARRWTEAIAIYETGLTILPANAFLGSRLTLCKKKAAAN